jgi:hypothetical protein
MVAPAIEWLYLSNFPNFIKEAPNADASTIAHMVNTVTTPKTRDTQTTPARLLLAAGYINIGINGSQGPSTNIVNRIQGVTLPSPSE